MDKIIRAIPLDDFRIDVVTSSGVSGVFDVKPYLRGSAFKELKDESYFRLVRPAHHGIIWPHEQDFSSDTIVWDIQNAQSGKGEFFSPPPHTTRHAGPHRAVHSATRP